MLHEYPPQTWDNQEYLFGIARLWRQPGTENSGSTFEFFGNEEVAIKIWESGNDLRISIKTADGTWLTGTDITFQRIDMVTDTKWVIGVTLWENESILVGSREFEAFVIPKPSTILGYDLAHESVWSINEHMIGRIEHWETGKEPGDTHIVRFLHAGANEYVLHIWGRIGGQHYIALTLPNGHRVATEVSDIALMYPDEEAGTVTLCLCSDTRLLDENRELPRRVLPLD